MSYLPIALNQMEKDAKNLEKDSKKAENVSRWRVSNRQVRSNLSLKHFTSSDDIQLIFPILLQVLEAVTEVREAVEGEKEIRQRQIVEGSRLLAKKLEAEDRKLLVKMCDDVDEFTKAMTQLRKKAQVRDCI